MLTNNHQHVEEFINKTLMLDEKYGAHGTDTRNEFDEQSIAWFYGNMFKERHAELFITTSTKD